MKAVTIYGIPNCDTMKKAFAALDAAHVKYSFHNYKKEGITNDKLRQWTAVIGVEQLVNKKGTTWRKLDPSAQADLANIDKLLAWLEANPSAIKRPLIETGKKVVVGLEGLTSILP